VLSAGTGQEALIVAATSALDVIVLDLALPDID
jgi:CheY-like chemotaxis protein